LDALYDKGVSSLYQGIGERVVNHLGLDCQAVHLDSTSFHYDGQATPEGEFGHIRIAQGYEGVSYDSEYGSVKQTWLLIRSEQAYKREQHNLNKRMLKAGEQARKSFKQLNQQHFACAQDAQSDIVKWRDRQTVCDVNARAIEVAVYANAGRVTYAH
jgi:transposase